MEYEIEFNERRHAGKRTELQHGGRRHKAGMAHEDMETDAATWELGS